MRWPRREVLGVVLFEYRPEESFYLWPPLPWYLGFAWRDHNHDCALVMLIPFNRIARALRSLWLFLRYPDPGEWDLRQEKLHGRSFAEGYQMRCDDQYQNGYLAAQCAIAASGENNYWLLIGGPADGIVVEMPLGSPSTYRVRQRRDASGSMLSPENVSASPPVEYGEYKPESVEQVQRRVMRWQGRRERLT